VTACVFGTLESPAKTADLIDMPLVGQSNVGPKNCTLHKVHTGATNDPHVAALSNQLVPNSTTPGFVSCKKKNRNAKNMASAGARAYMGGLGAVPPAGSRGRAPGQGVMGAKQAEG